MKYVVDKKKDVYTILRELATTDSSDFEIFIPNHSLILENRLNLEFLQESLEKLGKSARFSTDSPTGEELLDSLQGSASAIPASTALSESDPNSLNEQLILSKENSSGVIDHIISKLAFFRFPSISFHFPKIRLRPVFLFFPLFAALVLFAIGFKYVKSQKAYVKLTVESGLLVKSFPVVVDSELPQDIDTKSSSLKGKQFSQVLIEEVKGEATGQVLEGKKATGEVKIYNRTEESKKLSKGTKLKYKDGDEELEFRLTEEITVPAVSYEKPEDPGSPMIPGEKTSKVEALDIGESYNIEEEKTLTFSDYKKSELVAKSIKKFTGGESKMVKIVSQDDINKALDELKAALTEKSEDKLPESAPAGYKFIEGSVESTYSEPEVDAKAGEKTSEFTVKGSSTVKGLFYSQKNLEKLALQLLTKFIPESSELIEKNIMVEASPLGNAEKSQVSSKKADLQVTARAEILPVIDAKKLKEQLRGKSVEEVSKVLGSIKEASAYEFEIKPVIPFFNKVPNDLNRIIVDIVRQE